MKKSMKRKTVALRRLYISLSDAASARGSLSSAMIENLAKERPYWRDLRRRLEVMPLIPKGRIVATESGTAQSVIRFAKTHGMQVYYGYLIVNDGKTSSIDPHVFCVDAGKVVEVSKSVPWNTNCYYVGIPIPANDLEGCKFQTKFERMDYILHNVESNYVR